MAMHAPFAAGPTGLQGGKGRCEIDEAGQSPVLLLHDLMQVDAIIEGGEILLRHRVHPGDAERGTELQFGYPDARPEQAREGGGRLLILQSAVANVVTDADVP